MCENGNDKHDTRNGDEDRGGCGVGCGLLGRGCAPVHLLRCRSRRLTALAMRESVAGDEDGEGEGEGEGEGSQG